MVQIGSYTIEGYSLIGKDKEGLTSMCFYILVAYEERVKESKTIVCTQHL